MTRLSGRNLRTSPPAKQISLSSAYALLLLLLVLAARVDARAANGEKPTHFPMPEVLKPNVAFWEKVYAVWSESHVALHDLDDLTVIYEVIDLASMFTDPTKASSREMWGRINDTKSDYQKKLLSLAHKLKNATHLSEEEQRLRALFGKQASHQRIEQAANNIRAQRGLRERFALGLRRSAMYDSYIKAAFKKYNLPEELSLLPHVESSFNYTAYSKVGAAGLWQFMRGTAREFMTVNYDVDERFDPVISTESAARLLRQNYEELGSWPLAITAYNHGLNGMKRAKSQFGDDIGAIVQNYQSRSFRFASRNFYAEFLAAVRVVQNYRDHFGELEFFEPLRYTTIVTQKYYNVGTILNTFNLSMEEFKKLNPALRRPVLEGERRIPRGYTIRLPDRPDINERALWADISPQEQYSDQVVTDWYKVRRGDNLSIIARRMRTTVSALMAYNELDNKHRIYVGQILKVPPQPGQVPAAESGAAVMLADAGDVAKKLKPETATRPTSSDAAPSTAPPLAPGARDAGTRTVDAPTRTPVKIAASPDRTEKPATEASGPFIPTNGLAVPDIDVAPPNMRVELASQDAGGFLIIPLGEPLQPVLDEQVATFIPEPISEWITVEPEETLGHYAEWLELPASKLRRLNKIGNSQEIRIGQKFHLSFDKVSAEEFQRRRFEYQKSIEEDFFSTFRVDGVRVHTVKRGQSIWYLTNRLYDLPLWLLAKYNPGLNLQDLHIGDQINIPLVVENSANAQPVIQ